MVLRRQAVVVALVAVMMVCGSSWAQVGGSSLKVVRVQLDDSCPATTLNNAAGDVLAYLPNGSALVASSSPMVHGSSCRVWTWTAHEAISLSLRQLVAEPRTLERRESSLPLAIGMLKTSEFSDAVRHLSALGVSVQWIDSTPRLTELGVLVPPAVASQVVAELSTWPELVWADVLGGARLLNAASAWHCQSNEPGATPVFAAGLRGEGQIVGIMDTGIDVDMCYFADPDLGDPPLNDASGTASDPAQRKVVAVDFYWDQDWPSPGVLDWDDHGHGTHVAGSVAGDDGGDGLHDGNDGMAPAAQLVIQDGGYRTDNCADLPGLGCPVRPLEPVLQQAYDQGARIHSNSWGDEENITPYNRYTERSADVDRFMWEHSDMLVLFAAGNSGSSDDTVSSPSTAKNGVSVAAGDHGDDDPACIAYFSSRGWTHDGRIKPDVVAPGVSVMSADSDGNISSDNCDDRSSSGTSMACPTAAGLAALTRQYLTDGFHPLGEADPRFGSEPTGALVKGLLIASAQDISGDCASVEPVPSRDQGWGRIQLDRALAFPDSEHRLLLQDRSEEFANAGDPGVTNQVEVTEQGLLKVVLVWTDPPSSSVAATNLVNDLDLTVTGPDGTFLGNVMAAGVSVMGGAHDRLNNVEVVLLPTASAGTWTVTVAPHQLPVAPQGYALVVVGSVASCGPSGAPGGVSVADGGTGTLEVSWTPSSGPYHVWRRLWGCDGAGPWQSAGSSVSGSSLLDDQVAPGATYAYTVVEPDGEGWCGHRISDCAVGTASGVCGLPPQFAGVASVELDPAAECGLVVSWPASTGSCTGDVRYSVYRSTSTVVPADAAHRVATGVVGTEWVDHHVHDGMEYTYLVRAEDIGVPGSGPNGGTEDGGWSVRTAVASGPEVVVLADSGGDGSLALTGDVHWSFDSGAAHSGSSSWVGCQTSGICSSLTSDPLALEGGERLEFWTRWGIEPRYDGGVVEIRPTGAAQWSHLALVEGYPDEIRWASNSCGYPDHTPAFSSAGHFAWERYTADLSPWAGQVVEIRFTCSTDGGVIKAGWWLDDIRVWRMGPCTDQADPDCNGSLEVADVPHLLAVLFGGTVCGGEDVNGDGQIDAADLTDVLIGLN